LLKRKGKTKERESNYNKGENKVTTVALYQLQQAPYSSSYSKNMD
jgi:hypothetical protein